MFPLVFSRYKIAEEIMRRREIFSKRKLSGGKTEFYLISGIENMNQ